MATWIWVIIGSRNGLLPDGIKSLTEPLLTYGHLDPVAFTSDSHESNFTGSAQATILHYTIEITPLSLRRVDELTHCGLVMPYDKGIWVNIPSGNGLLPDGTKPLPEPMLTYHQ